MANQIVVSSGAKVRDLNDVIIGTSGVLSSLAFNVSNGVPKLDVNGKILVSQLPNSVMEYLGTWNAATNTPFLVNGTGNAGDVYLCNVAGTVDFGAGPISFVVSDQVIYSGSIWQKASGSNGTVTSVAVTESGDSLNITGSPITTSGTINIGFNGTNLQYINGAGDLTTFPTLLSSVGLSMPSAFSVSNSPLTANGTIAVTGAGYPSQYIRGDGTLADFPTSGGGGSSVSYYLNGGTSQGTIGGVTYYEMSKTADTGTGVDFTKSGDGFIVAFLTDAGDPAQLNIPAGNWNYEIYASMSANGGTPEMYAELYKYDGTTFTLIATSSNEILYDGVNLNLYTFAMTVPATTLALTDRLAVKLYATNSGGKTTTVHTQDSHLCQVITTFSTGITALNGLTAQVQYFATGTSGTDFAISSSTATHTFNLPVASASNTGKLSSTDWSTFNGKESVLTFSSPLVRTTNTISIPAATTLVNGYLTSTDWTTFNSKQATISLTTTGTSGAATFVSNTLNIPNYGSALSGYLPLSGGTLTGLLNGTSADFSSSVSALELLLDSAGTASATFVKNTNGTGVISTGANQIGFNLNNAFFITSDNKGCSIFSFNHSSSSYTYTLPSANGTIALTTDLGSYLPLAGGTLTGALNGTSAVFSSTVQASAYRLTGMTGGSGALYWSSDRVTLANYNATGVVNIEANGGTSIATFGGATYNNDFVGTGRFTGIVTFGSTLSNGTYTYTLPSATGTLALVGGAGVGTVTSVAALTLGTTGTDLSSTVANSTTTPVITLNVPTASATNRGALSSADWTTFNGKQSALTNPVTGTGTSGQVTYFNGTSTVVGSSSHFWDASNNRLGIGTSSPSSPLSISTNVSSSALSLEVSNSGTYGLIGVRRGTQTGASAGINYYTTTAQKWFTGIYEGSDNFGFYSVAYAGFPMVITTGGNVGIGTTGPSYQLQLSTDSAAKPTSALWTIASDERIKENINPYNKGLEDLLKINPITYDYNGLGGFAKGKGGVGIIAQEIIDILPDSVSSIKAKLYETDSEETDILNFNGHELTYVLINAIKEQQIQIQNLQEQINILAK